MWNQVSNLPNPGEAVLWLTEDKKVVMGAIDEDADWYIAVAQN